MNLPNYKMYNQAAGIESAALGRLRDHYPPRPRENDGRTNPELLDSFSSRKRLAEADHTPNREVYPMLMHRGHPPNAPIRNSGYMHMPPDYMDSPDQNIYPMRMSPNSHAPNAPIRNQAYMHTPADFAETPGRNIYAMRMPPNSHAPNAPTRNPAYMTRRP